MGTIIKNGVSYSGTPITVDGSLNSESINPIQNKVVAENFASVDERLNEVETIVDRKIIGSLNNETKEFDIVGLGLSNALLVLSNDYGQGALYYVSFNTKQSSFAVRTIYQSSYVNEVSNDSNRLKITVSGATFSVILVKLS